MVRVLLSEQNCIEIYKYIEKKAWLDADIMELCRAKQKLFRSYKLDTT